MVGMFGKLFTDNSYNHRKVLNAPDVIKAIKQLGYTYEEIADNCGVSKTMISRWGSEADKSLPTKQQLTPILKKVGAGRVMCDVEILSPAARQYPPIYNVIVISILALFVLVLVWWLVVEPCASNIAVCGKLPWYEMVSFGQNELKVKFEALQNCRAPD
ncbi:helix-turn-helix domain-containing protein [Vibrio aestuarianus]|uniref:Helix-turn-helix transcriptional regulator n=1 Tax=Vibrio aestuarianus TaxID=28171 RepID=A0A9X4IV40_9VIBR|nr:helix-turn-helix transcriptional regulator [Vibrio aestuarianus]MDE1233390.1 helix-turn-helix transcriptional regulator [Vibrio aestuarianus]MDE1237057.1 helix-turn-helix transcriptional regulator [Vibrio aestuarianus]MDE1244229.1 helix-turn-helix transcriptional regulator [Vibrio aestuarianus]MDE1248006.1 helix-turn-helix transcriptional regulator [Vibrio aestuarianus]NGZ65177.1 helix-turn-helix transcriptional regulator [Vibrio aestuarianus subsp. cardii]